MNLAAEDSAPVTRRQSGGSVLQLRAGCMPECSHAGSVCQGVGAAGRARGSHCSHSRALSSPKLPQAKSNTLSNGLLPELSHKKFNVF